MAEEHQSGHNTPHRVSFILDNNKDPILDDNGQDNDEKQPTPPAKSILAPHKRHKICDVISKPLKNFFDCSCANPGIVVHFCTCFMICVVLGFVVSIILNFRCYSEVGDLKEQNAHLIAEVNELKMENKNLLSLLAELRSPNESFSRPKS